MKKFPTSLKILSALFLIGCLHAVESNGQTKKGLKGATGYGLATYSVSSDGQFMRHWQIAGPVWIKKDGAAAPDEVIQKNLFKEDIVTLATIDPKRPLTPLTANGTSISWVSHSSKEDVVNLDALFNKADYASAYAMAEIISDADKKVVFAFGSDDGIKVILNGKVIHDNWTPRATTPDQDIVPASLRKGSNQLIVKVQDMSGDWSFTARVLDKKALSEKLVQSATSGNIDEITMLFESGADANAQNDAGLTALNAAKIHGRTDVMKLLLSKGATETALPGTEKLVDHEYSSLNGKLAAGISVLVAQDGKILYKKGFGYGDINAKELVTHETKFRIGSITKQFIGAAILKLQEDGKISVHDNLSKFIPDFPKGDEVTIHHLLTHTSGIHSFTNKTDFISRVTSPISETELVEEIKKDPYDFEPGERFLYNNSGYFLLGHIIRKVTGQSFGDYLTEKFFKPLGMTNTGVHSSALKLTNEAKGYKKENGEYKQDINWDMSWAGGAGALYSTVEDLYKWNEGIFKGNILSPGSLNAAFTPVILNNGKTPAEGKYGYGWAIGNFRGEEVLEHGGGLHGFSTRIARYPAENLTVVMLTNVIPTEVNLNPNSVAEFFIWDKMESQSSFSLDKSNSEDVKPYTGRYDFGNGLLMTLTAEDNNLFAQLTGQGRFPIFPSAPGEYFWRVVSAKLKFVRNEKGEVTGGEFSQNGSLINIIKLKDDVIVTIDPALFNFYIGKYDLGDEQVTVTTENNKLYAQTNSSPRFEIKPLSDHEFTLQELNAKVIFVREGNSKASKFILDMSGQKKDVPRIE
jgi:CubicO group peptidase (beta-lactamase class C family)